MNDAPASSFSDSSVFVGIDVSKKKLDVCLLTGASKQSFSFDNSIEPLRFALHHAATLGYFDRYGPLAQVVFSPDPVFDYRSTRRGDRAKGRALMLGLFRRGIFLNPMSTKLYLSLAHTEDDLGRFLEAARATLREDC